MMIRILIFTFMSSSPLHAEIFNCSNLTAAQFVSELAVQEKKFKTEVDKKEFEEIHELVGKDPFYELGLILWPEYLASKVFYTEAFEECSQVAYAYIKTVEGKSSNEAQFAEWRECLQLMSKESPSAMEKELDQCFGKYRRK